MVKRSRGVALATALMLLALVLVIGLALASTSMLSLNLSRQSYQETRCGLLARSGANELIARLQKLEASQDVQLFNPKPIDLARQLPGKTELLPGCWVTFDRGLSGYSTDNSVNETPAAGWLDHGRATTSVPPFTLEVILNVEQGGFNRSYRALIRRVWPYAIYSGGGPIVLTGDPGPSGRGSHVTGRVFAQVKNPARFRIMDASLKKPSSILFGMFTSEARPVRDSNVPVEVGPSVTTIPGFVSIEGDPVSGPADIPSTYYIPRQTSGAYETHETKNSEFLGSVDYVDEFKRKNLQALVHPGNLFRGRVSYRARDSQRDPLRTLEPGTGAGYSLWNPPGRMYPSLGINTEWVYGVFNYDTRPAISHIPARAGERTPTPSDGPPIYLLWGEHTLKGEPRANSYLVNGSLVNRIICNGVKDFDYWAEPKILVEEYGFNLQLEDCVLHVKGDLDLCDLTGRNPNIKGIRGNGATLIVEGTLSVTGAQIRAGDRGMVIYANNINLAGSGDFSGLLVARNSISIVPQPGKRINIRGGIVTAGSEETNLQGAPGTVLHNVDVQYDPRYLKSLNAFGEYRLTAWEPL